MEINSSVFKQVVETRYLSVENTWRYRTILRYFYLQYQKMKYWMYKEEIYEELIKSDYFKDYTMDQCKQDLDVLIEWKNLTPIQDTAKASTIEEFKNKQYRYQLSEYTVEIERLTIRLENLKVESASLEPSLLERLKIELDKFDEMVHEDISVVGDWWGSLNEDFKRLNQNYQDYMRDLHGIKAEEMMKTREFLLFKDVFIDYLRDFIKALQQNSYSIEAILKGISPEREKIVLNKVLDHNKSIPRVDTQVSEEAIKDNIDGRWTSLKSWFLGENGNESETAKLFDITNEIIRKITRFAYQIVETRNSAANRKEEYKKLCEMFLNYEDIDEAHKLSSLCFGLFNTRHIKGDILRTTESTNASVYKETPHVVAISPRVRTYREKRDRTPIPDNHSKKNQMLLNIIKEKENEKSIMENYIIDGQLDFSKLPTIESKTRTTLLRWISKGMSSSNWTSKTEDGRVYKVVLENKDKTCILDCEDGKLQMPAYRIMFD